jgi:hypothetical protein
MVACVPDCEMDVGEEVETAAIVDPPEPMLTKVPLP